MPAVGDDDPINRAEHDRLADANKHDAARNPVYFYMSLFMKWLLIGVFTFFGIHTVLWLYRSLRTLKGKAR